MRCVPGLTTLRAWLVSNICKKCIYVLIFVYPPACVARGAGRLFEPLFSHHLPVLSVFLVPLARLQSWREAGFVDGYISVIEVFHGNRESGDTRA